MEEPLRDLPTREAEEEREGEEEAKEEEERKRPARREARWLAVKPRMRMWAMSSLLSICSSLFRRRVIDGGGECDLRKVCVV